MTGAMADRLGQGIRHSGLLGERKVHYFTTVESTNTLALAMAKDGAAPGTVLVAETQTRGRGRLGKTWSSPAGTGLYCTVLLQPNIPLAQLARITLAAGLATAKALDEVGGVSSTIKWPNDVLLEGRKIAGILAECDLNAGLRPAIALGVGINLTTLLDQFPQDLRPQATSLVLASGRTVDTRVMLTALLAWIDREIERLEQGDFAGILDEWKKRDATAQKKLSWLTADGRTICGQSLGPDQEGFLVIRDGAGLCHHVMSGDITLDPSTLNGYFP